MGLELSADRVFLGVIALMIGVVWAWLSLKGKMPFAQESEPLPYPPTTAQNPVEKLMRGAVCPSRDCGLCGCGNDARGDGAFIFAYLFFWTHWRYTGNVGFIGNACLSLL
ncbi:hypothetical protein QIU19_02720 [Capnocytophaga canimorsus]|nr:hypothetical protein [Capnocytophaga canimorsus]WGU68864.1 hypothetical protein QIU19_02720 [Capnocytophaga canimorsus]